MIRPMVTDDVLVIAEWMVRVPLWQRYQLTISRITASLSAAITQGQALLSVIERDAIPCGFTWVLQEGAFGRSPYLKQIAVHPDHTGEGLGARLLQAAEAQALPYSSHFFLLVSDFNLGAQRFYRQQGYQHLGAIPAFVLPDVAELIFYKHLAEQPNRKEQLSQE